MREELARHDEILRGAIEAHHGHVLKSTGDGVLAVFARAGDAVGAAVDAQTGLCAGGLPPVRMGVHTGVAEERDGDYFGPTLNRAARVMAVAHGGQIVVSGTTHSLVEGFELIDLGEHRLRDLADAVRVFQVVHPNLRAEFPPLRSLDALPGNLPRQVTSFVGRESEVVSLAELVCRSSLLTLTGVGGVGKTRLALQVAAEAVGGFPDGAWLCEFAPVSDPGAVWDTLAACLRVQPVLGRSLDASVLDYLAAKRLLLVLDNCEHLLDAVARLVDAIAQRCPRVAVLATSREGLALAGEQIVAVGSLGLPVDNSDIRALMAADAVRLFCDRAAAAKDDFVLTEPSASAVGVLCRRLDGIPLAIELAAARVRSLPPEDLVARLDQRFKLLTRGSRAALERHQTLRSTIDWSYDLLEPAERQALDGLSVFAGGCDLAAAEAVLADDSLDEFDVVDIIGKLVDKSLVVADNTDHGVRYRLLESIRQYAAERLEATGATEPVRRRHADHYLAVAEAAGPHLRSRDQRDWNGRLTREIDNLRAVLDWAVDTPSPEHALRLIIPLTVSGMTAGYAAMDWATSAIAIPGADDHPLFVVVASWAAWGAIIGGDYERSETLIAVAQHAEQVFDTRHPHVERSAAILAYFRGDFEQGRVHAHAYVERARATTDRYELAESLVMLAATQDSADPEASIATLDESIRIARDAGLLSTLSMGLLVLAQRLPAHESDRILELADEAIDIGTQLADPLCVATALQFKGAIAAQRREWSTALHVIVDSTDRAVQLGNVQGVGFGLGAAGVALCGLGIREPAAVLIGKADSSGFPSGWWAEMLDKTRADLVDSLGAQQFEALTARGAALDTTDAVAYFHTQTNAALLQD